MQRSPAVAGRFYPEDAENLRQLVQKFLGESTEHRAMAMMVPHAGYLYSGAIAGKTYGQAGIPPRIILLGPDHHCLGPPLALSPLGGWRTPLGICQIDRELHERVLRECPDVVVDASAHRYEHSLEVQLPFIQVRSPAATILPLAFGPQPLASLLAFGRLLGGLLSETDGTMLVASSDLTHYETAASAESKDRLALRHIISLDAEGLYHSVRQHGISMCGLLPVVAMLVAARQMGACQGRLVCYGHSGKVTGEQDKVVGYAGVIID